MWTSELDKIKVQRSLAGYNPAYAEKLDSSWKWREFKNRTLTTSCPISREGESGQSGKEHFARISANKQLAIPQPLNSQVRWAVQRILVTAEESVELPD